MNSEIRKDDAEFIALFDQQIADEVQHVRFANVWTKKLVAEEGPRTMMALARGIAQGDAAFKEVVGTRNMVTFFFKEAAPPETCSLSLHDALPISTPVL